MTDIILLIAGAVLNLGLGTIALVKSKHSNIKVLFALLTLSLTMWSIFNYFSVSAINKDSILLLMRLVMFFAVLQSVFFFLFSTVFPEGIWSIKTKFLMPYLIVVVLTLAVTLSPFLFSSVTVDELNGSRVPVIEKGMLLFLVTAVGSLVMGFIKLLKKLIGSRGYVREQIKFLFIGVLSMFSLMILFNLVLVMLFKVDSFVYLGTYFTLPFVGFTTYAILTKGLFDIKLLLTEVGTLIVILALLLQTLMSKNLNQGIANSVLLVVVTYGGWVLVRSVVQEIKRREEMEKLALEKMKAFRELDERNRNLTALQKFSNIVLDNIDLKPMIQEIIDIIPKEVAHCFGAYVVLADKDKNIMKGLAASDGQAMDQINEVIEKDITQFSLPLDDRENMLMHAYHEQAMQRGNNLADFLAPPLSKTLALNAQHVSGIHGLLAIPLSAGDDHYGVLLYGMKVPIEHAAPEEINMMTAIADEVSLAIQRGMAYEELKKANEYLKQLDKMKDEFISVASHELNTPLAAIEGYLSMILDEHMGKVDKTAKEYLDRVYESSKRLAALILDLLNVSRIEQGRIHILYSKVNIEEMAQSVADELSIKAKPKNLYLKFEKPKHPIPENWIDANRIREVIVNFVGNAIKFTEKGGITIRTEAKGDQMVVSVADTGVGIAPADAEKLFKKFSQLDRAKNETQGTGLGLYISKNYIEMHKGKIWVESQKGKGATFKFSIPIWKEKPYDPYEGEGAVLKQAVKDTENKEPEKTVADSKTPSSYTLAQ